MKKVISPVIQYAIGIAKRSKFVQSLFEAPFDLSKFPVKGEFTDSLGNKHQLLDGLRTKIKAGWENVFKEIDYSNVSPAYLDQLKANGETALVGVSAYLTAYGKTIKGSDVLEIGCNTGATSYAIADLGAKSVTGSEFSGYQVKSIRAASEQYEEQLVKVNKGLELVRQTISKKYKNSDRVSFADDDICNSKLPEGKYDIIFSWDVLEHIHDTQKAFESMGKLLKKDGIMVHLYNPFCSLNGGHSLCTLDFLWGHARLSNADFETYVKTVRPDEIEKAISFHQSGLNRMTLADLSEQLEKANLEVHSIVPYSKEQHARMVNQDILSQVKHNYPTAQLMDLITPRVFVVAKRKN